MLNPFRLRVPLESIVCYFITFENNLRIKNKLTRHLKESCCLTSRQHFFFKYIPKKAFLRKIFPKCHACFGCSQCEWVNPSKVIFVSDLGRREHVTHTTLYTYFKAPFLHVIVPMLFNDYHCLMKCLKQ